MSPQIGINPTLMTQLINGMKRVSGTLPDLALQLERALTCLGVHLWGPSPIHGIARQMADQIPALQGRLDLILAEPDRKSRKDGVLWANDSAWLSNSPAEGAATAHILATKLRDQIAGHALSAETVAEIERHKNDPYFAMAFAKEIPPRELKNLIGRLYGGGLSLSARPLQRDVATQDRLVTMLSTLLGTASRGVGRLTLAGDYADQMVEDIEHPQDAFAVKRLLQDGTFDHAFLLALVRKLYDADFAHPRDLSLPQDPWTMPGPRDASPGDLSPMGTALVALAHHPAVAQDFFTDPQRRPLAYLMRQHPWIGGADADLGWAIQGAATEFRDHEMPPGGSRGYKSALIASWAVRFWSDPKIQENLPHTRHHLGEVLAQYTPDMHRALQTFGNEVPGVMTDLDPDKNLPGTEPYGALFDAKEMKRVMTWAFEDDETFQKVTAAHGLYSAKTLEELASNIAAEIRADFIAWRREHPHATQQELDAKRQDILEERMSRSGGAAFAWAAGGLSRTTWVIADAANISEIEEAKENDARFATFRAMTDAVAGLAPGPQVEFIGLLVRSAEQSMFGQRGSSEEDQARADADDARGAAKHMFTDLTAAVLMRHGLFGEETAPARTHPYKHKDFSPGAAGHFMVNGEMRPWTEMNADQRRAYDDWLGLGDTGRIMGKPGDAVGTGFDDADDYYSGHGT